jgi:hypothetical protein
LKARVAFLNVLFDYNLESRCGGGGMGRWGGWNWMTQEGQYRSYCGNSEQG